MPSQHDTPKRWQFKLVTLLIWVLFVAFLCANVVPRYSMVESGSEYVEHSDRGFPFTFAEDVKSRIETRGTRNLAALVGDVVIALLIVTCLFLSRFAPTWRGY